jgi:hypothetical protein
MKEPGNFRRKLLQLVEADGSLSLAELSEKAGMSLVYVIPEIKFSGVVEKVTLVNWLVERPLLLIADSRRSSMVSR